MTDAATLVAAFETAVNARDADAAARLAHPDVEITGPRGSARGREVLRDWVTGSGIELHARRIFAARDVLVAEQRARWTGDPAERTVATVFGIADGLIAHLARHDDLDAALAAAGLSAADEV